MLDVRQWTNLALRSARDVVSENAVLVSRPLETALWRSWSWSLSKNWSITSCKKQQRCHHNHTARLLMMRSAHMMVSSQTVHLHRRSHYHHSSHLTRRRPLQHWLPSQCHGVVRYRHTLRPQTPMWRPSLTMTSLNVCSHLSVMYCVPVTSALWSVERIFNHGGIFMHPYRVSDSVLCNIVFSKCNVHL